MNVGSDSCSGCENAYRPKSGLVFMATCSPLPDGETFLGLWVLGAEAACLVSPLGCVEVGE